MSSVKSRASLFVVDFGKVNIPSLLEKELELEFQKIALSALARIDHRGDLRIGRLPPGTYGMIFGEWPPDIFFPTFPPPTLPDIDVRDHTLVIEAVMNNGLALTRMLAGARKQDRRISGVDVLKALEKLPNLDQPVKRAVEQTLKNIHLAENRLPREATAALEEINKQLDACETIEEVSTFLSRLQRSERLVKVDGLLIGLSVASQIIADGRSTIYSPENPFYGNDPDSPAVAKGVKDVGKEDVKGALTGGMGGALAGPKGAAAGALAGGIAGSAAEALSQLWDSIFG